jgi:MoxR-like ATPase
MDPSEVKPARKAAPIGDIPLTMDAWLIRDLPELDRIMGEWFFTTSRTLLIGPTGVGKTNFGMAIAGHSAIGRGFLHWRAQRPSRSFMSTAKWLGDYAWRISFAA